MRPTRREAMFGAGALALAGCAGGPGGAPAPGGGAMRAASNTGWDGWVAAYRGRARAAGIPAAVIDRAFRDAGYLPGVIENDRSQTEFTRTLEDYLAIAASDTRVREGRANHSRRTRLFDAIEARHGVPGPVVAAIWGLESSYGARRGDIPVVSATSTLAYDGRRGEFFERQLTAALRILASGDTTPGRLVGSWAGAMGHTQFIPTSYQAYAVDFDGDGRRDIWDDDPTDALASAANYLARSGWVRGQPWGVEVALPEGFSGPFGQGTRRRPSAWGVTRSAEGRPIPDAWGVASILRPSGAGGPAFMVFRNFDVLRRYNNAQSYVIGVGHLSDRIAGGGPLRGTFPPDPFGLTLEDRKALQRGLTRAGFDAGDADGVIGPQTQEAITAYQRARGLTVTGEPSRTLLAALR